MMRYNMKQVVVGVAAFLAAVAAQAGEVQMAVAANFTAPMKQIAAEFEQATGHKALVAYGATGKFYAQIANGAPFEVFLAADNRVPAKLAEEGRALADTRFTYALGTLVLWSAKAGLVDEQASALREGRYNKLAIANPRVAPYGVGAVEVLTALGLLEAATPRFVRGENIAQTYQFVSTGNADLGFVALSQVMEEGRIPKGSAWVVPGEMHQPMRQDAIVLTKGKDNPAAQALMAFLRSDKARAIIRSFGYGLE